MNVKDYPLGHRQWFPEATRKKYVVWHGTGGRTSHTPSGGRPGKATTSIDGWNRDDQRVGAPWLVDRDGSIYRTFDDRGWIYHLGLKDTNGRYDKASVAIELANELGLVQDGDNLHAFGMNTPNTLYDGPHFRYEWRGFDHFADFDPVQIDAAIELTLDICRRHAIEPVFYYPSTAYDYPRCFEVATILCHSNCRRDKSDLCLPEWAYENMAAAGIVLRS